MGGPLDGLLVADFSRVLAGPLATMLLGDLGADVVKVEQPEVGDDTRSWGPPFAAGGESTYFLSVNRNKRSVSLDLDDSEDRRLAQRLADRADVLVENFRSGKMRQFGLGYEEVSESNPGIVYCRLSGFGTDVDLPAYDFLVQALSGFMSITGAPDGPPTKTGVAIVDVLVGLVAAVGITTALVERAATGRGQLVEADLFSAALSGLVNQASNYLNGDVLPGRMGNQHPNIAPYETFATATEQIALAVGNDGQFKVLCDVLEVPALAADERFADNAGRVRHRVALRRELEAALGGRERDEWVRELRAGGVPCGPVNDVADAFALADRLGLDRLVELTDGTGRASWHVANPLHLAGDRVSYRFAPPGLDEHGEELRAWLRSDGELSMGQSS